LLDRSVVTRPAASPRPVSIFVIKVHSRCNLSCTYCYVYRHVDDGWRSQPATMSAATAAHLAQRIGDHARRHRIPRIGLVLHGGEPLLAGVQRLDTVVSSVRAAVPATTRVSVTVQTNGVLLDEEFLALFHRHGIRVGVSIDGDAAAHDRHRRFADGRGSFEPVRQALSMLQRPEHRDLYAGLLCTVDLANDPIAVYEGLLAFAPPDLDLLLPHGNWVHRPPGRGPDPRRTPYADWLIKVFDRWYSAPRRETGIRLFESLILLLLGGRSRTEAIGPESAPAITVETDGSMAGNDALKTTASGLAATGLNVRDHSFEEALDHPMIGAGHHGPGDGDPPCAACPFFAVCGGGLHAHRYDLDGGFANPSVYCPDLYRLIGHVQSRVRADLTARAARLPGRAVEPSG
jgi:uncharacterized protein